MALSVLGDAALKLGDAARASVALDESIGLKRRLGDANLPIALLRRAEVREATGELPGARADADEALAHALRTGNADQQIRARLWRARHDADQAVPGGEQALAALVGELAERRATMRGATAQLFDAAQERVRGAERKG
jgi:hypothetical protein